MNEHRLKQVYAKSLANLHSFRLHQLFEGQADCIPDSIAIIHEDEYLSYWELNERASRIAFYLCKLGVGPETRVCIMLERSVEMIIAILGVLKAGGAYIPLDPAYPKERLHFMIEDSESTVLLMERDGIAPVSKDKMNIVYFDDKLFYGDYVDVKSGLEDTNIAYVIYTSGSTGKPKGIAVTHRGVVNNITDINERFLVTQGDKTLAISSPSFDMSVYEVFGLLGAGGTIVIPQKSGAKDVVHWTELIRDHQITIWNSAPALLKILIEYVENREENWLSSLRLALLGGDWIPVSLPDRLKAIASGIEFISLGGVTEASIHSMIYEVVETDPKWKSIPYGHSMANQQALLLDPDLCLVSGDTPGEIHYGGVGLARGYLNRQKLTAEKFIPDPYGSQVGARIYKTNDRACFRSDGEVELIGRMDYQVKIRGMRVDLEEIAMTLRSAPLVWEAVVVTRKDDHGNQRLVAYVIPTQGENLNHTELRQYLMSLLPEHMVPATFVSLKTFPLSPNGKIDRLSLPVPSRERPELLEAFVAPRTPVEDVITSIWSEVLGLEQVGVTDDFIELGGHSLLATQVVTRLREVFSIDVPLRIMFESPTVARQSELIESLGCSAHKDVAKIARLLIEVNQLSDAEVKDILAQNG